MANQAIAVGQFQADHGRIFADAFSFSPPAARHHDRWYDSDVQHSDRAGVRALYGPAPTRWSCTLQDFFFSPSSASSRARSGRDLRTI